jgi:Cdc6-like AAA superfamily ATPase
MSDNEFSFNTSRKDKPPIMVIYGPAGVGKTSLAAQAGRAVFLQTEDGAGELELTTIKDGVFKSYDELMGALRFLYVNHDTYDTIVIDTLDHLEPLIWAHVCTKNNWDSIEAPGYGKGYIECDKVWLELINGLIKIRDGRGKTIIILAHELVRTINDPMTEAFDAHELKLHKRAVAFVKEKCDMIGLLKNRIVTDSKTGKGRGGSTPTLFVRPSAAFTAKTRYQSMPASIQIDLGTGWAEIAQYIPALNQPTNNAQASE